jgi:hypothetical protein
MTEYERMGNGGTRAATIIVNQSAMCYFEKSKYVFYLIGELSTPSEIWKE